MLRGVLAARRKTQGDRHPDVAQTLTALGRNLLQQRKAVEAEPLLREGLAIWEAKRPDDWNRFDTQSLLGDSLLDQEKFADSEPLLLAGYEGMKSRESRIPTESRSLLTKACERVAQLYELTGRKEKATEWRARLQLSR
jgi:hypothetical protein